MLLQSNEFEAWLKAEIEKYAPVSTSHVVCLGDFKDQIVPLLGIFGSSSPTMLTPEQLRDPELEIGGSVIVICPSFTKGTKLLEVSRDLRKQNKLKNKYFFICLFFKKIPMSKRLSQNIGKCISIYFIVFRLKIFRYCCHCHCCPSCNYHYWMNHNCCCFLAYCN